MSWSFSVPKTKVSEFDAAIDAAAVTQKAQIDGWPASLEDEKSASKEQVDAAVAATKSLVGSGVAGGFDLSVSAELSGHANPHHAPKDGMANDQVRIAVLQTPAAA